MSLERSAVYDYITNTLHTQLLSRYSIGTRAKRDKVKAKKLQQYLNEIANTINYMKKNPNQKTPASSLLVQYLINNGLDVAKLFNYSNVGKRYGFEFEDDLQHIINSAFNSNISKNIGASLALSKSTFTGKQLTDSGIKIKVDQFIDNLGEGLENWVKKDYSKYIEYETDGVFRQSGVMGKIDLHIPNSTISLNINVDNSITEFLSLLNDMNISAKNYTNIASIHLGKSGWFRVVNTLLSDLRNEDMIIPVYEKTNKGRLRQDIRNHKHHMRFIYELMGPGQYYDINGHLQTYGTVDYLVVYNRAASVNPFIVKSTADLVQKEFANSSKMSSTITINLTKE